MIKIKDYEVKNKIDELLISEYEYISMIYNDTNIDNIDKWVKIFQYLGVPIEVIDELDLEEFLNFIKEFQLNIDTIDSEVIKTIIINDVEYTSYEEEFKLSVKDMGLIENYIKEKPDNYIGEAMAVIYKNRKFDRTIHYDKSHIKMKAEQFRKNVTCDKVMPILNVISKKLIKDGELINPE